MSTAAILWQNNLDLALASLNCPFVQGIGDGSLSSTRFAYYIGQDAFFLESFARAYSVAAGKAPDLNEFGTLHGLAGGVLQELTLHQQVANQWGITLGEVQPSATTRRYTDFLQATAWSQDIGMTAAAMLPCMRLYAFLGQTLAQPKIPSHRYTSWIQTYSSHEFDLLAQQLADVVDRYTSLSPLVQTTYKYAMQCELDFFQAAWNIEESN